MSFTTEEEAAARRAGYKNFQQMMDAQAARRRQMSGNSLNQPISGGEMAQAAKKVASGPFAIIDYVTEKYKQATGQK